MKNFLFSNVGFYTENTIKYAITKNQCDSIVLFTSKEAFPKAKELKEFIENNLKVDDVSIREVDPIDIWKTIGVINLTMDELEAKYKDDLNIVVDITGGSRVMTLAALMVAFAREKTAYYYFKDETDGTIHEIKIPYILFGPRELSWKKKFILLALYNHFTKKSLSRGKVAIETLSAVYDVLSKFGIDKGLKKTPSRISEDLSALQKLGLIDKRPAKGNRRKVVISLTYSGEQYVKLWLLSNAEKIVETARRKFSKEKSDS